MTGREVHSRLALITAVRKSIETFVTANGFELGTHHRTQTCGLLSGVYVKPEWSPIEGSHTIVVTPTDVAAYTASLPWMHLDWDMRTPPRPYSTPDELLVILRELTKEEQS